MKTAVEWLIEQIKKDSNLRLRGFDIDGVGKQAKAMEKEQMCECYNDGLYQDIHSDTLLPFEQYYNETYKNTNE